jgi:sugar phosphate isomerase/epimerase
MYKAKGGPGEFTSFLQKNNFRAGYLPYEWHLKPGMNAELAEIRDTFRNRNIILAEVGAWRNPFVPDPVKAKENTEYIIERLALADELNARCAVCTIGSPSDNNTDPANISDNFYDMAVEQYRLICDRVKPKYAKLCFELLPFNFLDSAEMYEKFIKDINRPKYAGIHLDPINLINSPRSYFCNSEIITGSIKRLAPYGIISMHLKDIKLHSDLPNTYLEEMPVGLGGCDIRSYLLTVHQCLPIETPVLIEHLQSEEQFIDSAKIIRNIAAQEGINI